MENEKLLEVEEVNDLAIWLGRKFALCGHS